MENFKKGDRVRIKYPQNKSQKQILTISHSEKFGKVMYWFVEEREFAIPENLLHIVI